MRGLVYQGRTVPADVEVVDGREHGLWWEPGEDTETEPNAGQCLTWHFQAGVGGPQQLHRVLRNRGLSVNLQMDLDGRITQMADLSTWTYHAGDGNQWGPGIEIAGFGIATAWRRMRALLRRRGHRPTTYYDTVHGHRQRYFRLLPAQMHAAFRLYLALERVMGLPTRWPMVPGTGRVVRTVLATRERWHGHLCHYHWTGRKWGVDPATADQLAARASLA